MSFVNDDGVVLIQISIVLHRVEQDAVGHHLDQCLLRRSVSEANLVPNLLAKFYLELLGDALCYGSCCNSTGLSVGN